MSRNGLNNKGGRPKGCLSPNTLKAIKTKEEFIQAVHDNLQPILTTLVNKANDGDISACKELLDRAWGKPHQGIGMEDKNGKPIQLLVKFINGNENDRNTD